LDLNLSLLIIDKSSNSTEKILITISEVQINDEENKEKGCSKKILSIVWLMYSLKAIIIWHMLGM
jgi:hypothetical protein